MRALAPAALVVGLLVGAVLVRAHQQKAPAPGGFSSVRILNSVRCDVRSGKVSNCKLMPGKTLDDVVQDWNDLYIDHPWCPGDDSGPSDDDQ